MRFYCVAPALPSERPRRLSADPHGVNCATRRYSVSPNQAVAFLADGEPRGPAAIEIGLRNGGVGGAHRLIVESHAALFDQPSSLALGVRHAERDRYVDPLHRRAAFQD